MISLLHGKVVSNNDNVAAIMTVGGVGYLLKVSSLASQACAIDNEVTLETYLVVREDALELFGFGSKAEKKLFTYFLSVSGVGPKTALHLLSLGSVNEISSAIAREDATYLTKVSGIGRKTAERIVVELKTKIKESWLSEMRTDGQTSDGHELAYDNEAVGDVIDALIGLGYSAQQARDGVKKVNPTDKTSEVLLREVLKIIR